MTLVLDAEPLLAFLLAEPGAASVLDLLRKVHRERERALCSLVNLTEVRYRLLRESPEDAAELLDWIISVGVEPVGVEGAWAEAAALKARHRLGLGDAFAVATAVANHATLVAGRDADMEIATQLGLRLHRVG